ncbi:MAG: InlB B-repeat-containing protein [Oscillospiraceae bacterium]|nr:InlB B-repeat-containing protein [Oscillospiraceae bacterium]
MKQSNWRKALSLIVVLAMVFSLCVPIMAAGEAAQSDAAQEPLISAENFVLYPQNNSEVSIVDGKIVTSVNRRFMALYKHEMESSNFAFSVEINPTDGWMEHFVGIHMSGIPGDGDGGMDPCYGYGVFLGEVNKDNGTFNIRMNKVAGGFKGWMPIVGQSEDWVSVSGLMEGMENSDTFTLTVAEVDGIVSVQVHRTDDPTLASPVVKFDLNENGLSEIPVSNKITLNANGWFTGEQYSTLKILSNEAAGQGLMTPGNFTVYTDGPSNISIADGVLRDNNHPHWYVAQYNKPLEDNNAFSIEIVPPATGGAAQFVSIHCSNPGAQNGGIDNTNGYAFLIETVRNNDWQGINFRMHKCAGGYKGWMPMENVEGDNVASTALLEVLEAGDTLTLVVSEENGIVTAELFRTDDPTVTSGKVIYDLNKDPLDGEIPDSNYIAFNANGSYVGAHYTNLKIWNGYSVTYNANFGDMPETVVDSQSVAHSGATSYDLTVDANPFTRENYTFTGWNTKADGSGTAYAADAALALTSDVNEVVLYAQWVENDKFSYGVVYSDNFGDDPATQADSENVSSVYDTAYTITADGSSVTREHFTFLGWNTKADGSGTSYAPGDKISFTESGTVMLYAQWEEDEKHDYSVIYNANHGDEPETKADSDNVSGVYEAAHSVTVDANAFVRVGYSFTGWNTKADGTGTAYTAGDTLPLTAEAGAVVLYAQWEEGKVLTGNLISNGNFTLYSWQNSGNCVINDGWIKTTAAERFLAVYNKKVSDNFTMSIELKPVRLDNGNLYLESFIGIGLSGIPEVYDSFDALTGHGVFIGEMNPENGNINIRMNRVAGGFKGWLTIDGVEGDNTVVTAEGLMAGADDNTTLVATITVNGDIVKVQLSRKDDPSKVSSEVIFNMSNPTSGGDTTEVPYTGMIGFSSNGWLTGMHYTNLALVDESPVTGDGSMIADAVAVMVLSLGGVICLIRKRED